MPPPPNPHPDSTSTIAAILIALAYATLAMTPSILLAIARRKARRIPKIDPAPYRETFAISPAMYAFAALSCLTGAGLIVAGLAQPRGAVLLTGAGVCLLGLGAWCAHIFRHASLVITADEIDYRLGPEKWRASRREIRRAGFREIYIPFLVLEMNAGPPHGMLLLFRDTARILFLLGLAAK
ncbi:MAG TPA: hypothetical protein VG733_02505 [Chthoniobacteraceae bacterium]|nr:hypothetical protein [Chthoniobacteraceae bacterium]